jgi:hypothetical protein
MNFNLNIAIKNLTVLTQSFSDSLETFSQASVFASAALAQLTEKLKEDAEAGV